MVTFLLLHQYLRDTNLSAPMVGALIFMWRRGGPGFVS
nr:MAG TPA: hypothetical protein [Caudoviricetes sp.]